MSENENKNVEILDKDYDGIIEHDHPLPNWWVATFVITVIFAVFYYGYYELLGGPSSDQELAEKMAQIESIQQGAVANAFDNLDEDVLKPEMISLGKEIYAGKCFMCHGDKGQGLIGPNLTDEFWIHGGSPKEILHVVQKGVPEKGMIPWESTLSAEEQIAAVAYIRSLRGTNPSGAKAPEGEEYKE